MTKRFATVLAVGLIVACGTETPAIMIRHDRDDTDYVALAEGWPAVGSLVPVGDGVVTLIAPRFAITAAHVADVVSPFTRAVRFGDTDYRIAGVYRHPTWEGEGDEMGLSTVDIALLELEEPVVNVAPAGLYRGSDEMGKVITFVGWGDTGTGESGPEGQDGKRRAATNQVSDVLDDWVKFVFDAPPEGTHLEGISGPGDSGGPALIEVDGQVHVMGISSFNEGTDIGECEYGSVEFYARVSGSVNWIDAVVRGRAGRGASWPDPVRLDGNGWPDSPAGKIADAFFRAYSSGDPGKLTKFEKRHRVPDALEQRAPSERAERWLEHRKRWGDLEAASYVASGDRDLNVLVNARTAERWYNFRFILQEEGKPKLSAIAIGWDTAPAND